MKEFLTTTSAARIAGVGVSSIKRWADEGKLRTVRTPGGHRRLVHSDLLAFLKDPEGHSALPEDTKMSAEWADAILGLEFHALQAKLLASRGRTGSWHLALDEVATGITETGIRWANQSISIADEHVATERLSRVLSSIYESIPYSPNAPFCLLANAEGDLHTLGLSMLQVSMREMGWQCIWLGSLTPISEVCQMLETHNIDMVALSASRTSTDTESLQRQLDQVIGSCKKANTNLIFGGAGAWPEATTYGHRLTNFSALPDLVEVIS